MDEVLSTAHRTSQDEAIHAEATYEDLVSDMDKATYEDLVSGMDEATSER